VIPFGLRNSSARISPGVMFASSLLFIVNGSCWRATKRRDDATIRLFTRPCLNCTSQECAFCAFSLNRCDQAEAPSVPLFAPLIHGHPPGVLPTGMAIEEHEVAAQSMPRGSDSAFAA